MVKTTDTELEAVLDRASKLRITMREIAEYTGETETQIWRWKTLKVKTNWERRQKFIQGVEELIEAKKDEYRTV